MKENPNYERLKTLPRELRESFDPGGNLPDDCNEWANEHHALLDELDAVGGALLALLDQQAKAFEVEHNAHKLTTARAAGEVLANVALREDIAALCAMLSQQTTEESKAWVCLDCNAWTIYAGRGVNECCNCGAIRPHGAALLTCAFKRPVTDAGLKRLRAEVTALQARLAQREQVIDALEAAMNPHDIQDELATLRSSRPANLDTIYVCRGCANKFTSSRAAADHSRATSHTISVETSSRPAQPATLWNENDFTMLDSICQMFERNDANGLNLLGVARLIRKFMPGGSRPTEEGK